MCAEADSAEADSDEFADPLDSLVGCLDVDPDDDIDAVIYDYDG